MREERVLADRGWRRAAVVWTSCSTLGPQTLATIPSLRVLRYVAIVSTRRSKSKRPPTGRYTRSRSTARAMLAV